MKITAAFFCLITCFSLCAAAEHAPLQEETTADTVKSVPLSGETMLGFTLTDIYTNLGIPAAVKTVRGPEEWQDDVVFVFANGLELYLCGDRVWQIKVTAKSEIPCRTLFAGTVIPEGTEDAGLSIVLQTPAETVFELNKTSYPVRISAQTDSAGIIQTLYMYRADY